MAGGRAVAVWVESAGLGGVRNTPNVDVLVCRADFPAARMALEAAGFRHRSDGLLVTFTDQPPASPRGVVHLLAAGERVRPTDVVPTPEVTTAARAPDGWRVVTLPALVGMKLTAYRTIDRVHLRDMMDVGLIDGIWPARLPPPLGDRLQAVLDDPDG